MVKDISNIDPKLLEEDDRIVAYLKGQMNAEEEEQFLKELEDNPKLKEKAIVTARLVKGLKQLGSEQDKNIRGAFLASSKQGAKSVAEQVSEMSPVPLVFENANYTLERKACGSEPSKETAKQKSASQSHKKHGHKFYKLLAIAASIIGIVWIGIGYHSYRHTTGLGDAYDEAFTSSIIVRGAGETSNAEKKLAKLFTDVKDNKDLEESIQELTLCWEISTMETYNDYTDYSAEIGWYLAIANLKNNNKTEAKEILKKLILVTEKGSQTNEKAKELLNQL